MQLSITILRGLAAYLRDRDVDTTTFLAKARLAPDLLSRGDATIALPDLARAVEAAFRLREDPALGLHLGFGAPIQTLGVTGEVAWHAPTLRTALQDAQRYLPLVLPMSRFRVVEDMNQTALVFEPALSERDAVCFATEVALGFVTRLVRYFDPQRGQPNEVRLRFSRPPHGETYATAFGAKVQFSCPRSEILLPTSALDSRQPFPDQALWTAVRRRADELLAQERSREQLHERVRHVLLHEVDLANVNPSYIARRLDVTPRSLRRRLGDEGHSLSALTDEVRRELSISELHNPEMPIKRIADRVGFSEVSAFHRAFKRWTGVTPARYRAQSALAEAS